MFPSGFGSNLLIGAAKLNTSRATTTLIVNGTTGSATMFTLTGTVLVYGLWGEVTTVLSANVTAAFVEMNDSGATPDVTVSTGAVLSAAPVGSLVYKESLVAVALQYKTNANAYIEEPASAGQPSLCQFIIGKKTAVTTILQFTYTTSDTPSSGAILWTALWMPLSKDGNLA